MRAGLFTLILAGAVFSACATQVVNPFPPFVSERRFTDDASVAPRLILPLPVTIGLENQYDGQLTPDGRFIVLVSEKEGDTEITRIRLEDLERYNLSNHSSTDYRPALSPDGESIAFISRRRSADGGAFTASIESFFDFLPDLIIGAPVSEIDFPSPIEWAVPLGDDAWLLVANENESGAETSLVYLDSDGERRTLAQGLDQPILSQDRQWVIGVMEGRLAALPFSGGEPRFLFANGESQGSYVRIERDPSFSPDGRVLYFAAHDEDTNGDGRIDRLDRPALFRAPFDALVAKAGLVEKLTANDRVHLFPRVSGDQVYFTTDRGGALNIWRLPADGMIPPEWSAERRLSAAARMTDPRMARLLLQSIPIGEDGRYRAEIRMRIADSFLQQGDEARALGEYERVCRSEEDRGYWCARAQLASDRLRPMGVSQRERNHRWEAFEALTVRFAGDPEIEARGWLQRGKLLRKLGREEEALDALDRLLLQYDDYRDLAAEAQLAKSEIFRDHFIGDPRPLMNAYRKAILDYPEQEATARKAASAIVDFTLNSPLAALRPLEALRTLFEESVDLPYLPGYIQLGIAENLLEEERPNGALDALLDILERPTEDFRLAKTAATQIAELSVRLDRTLEAAGALSRWLAAQPDRERAAAIESLRWEALLLGADKRYREGNFTESRELCRAILDSSVSIPNDNVRMAALRGEILASAAQGRLEEIPEKEEDPAHEYARFLSMTFGDEDDQSDALEGLDALRRRFPNSPFPFMAIGWLYEAQARRTGNAGDGFKALESYLIALAQPQPPGFSPLVADLQLSIAFILTRLGNHKKAETRFVERLRSEVPFASAAQRVSFYERWAHNLVRQGRTSEAREKWEEAIAAADRAERSDWIESLKEPIAMSHYLDGEWNRSRSAYEDLLSEIDPDRGSVGVLQRNIALNNIAGGDLRAGMKWLRSSLEREEATSETPTIGFLGRLMTGTVAISAPINKKDYSLAPKGFQKGSRRSLLLSLLAKGSGRLAMPTQQERYLTEKFEWIPAAISKKNPAFMIDERASILNWKGVEAYRSGWVEEGYRELGVALEESRKSSNQGLEIDILLNLAAVCALDRQCGAGDRLPEIFGEIESFISEAANAEGRTVDETVRLIRLLNARSALNASILMDLELFDRPPRWGSSGVTELERSFAPHLTRVASVRQDLLTARTLAESLPENRRGRWLPQLEANLRQFQIEFEKSGSAEPTTEEAAESALWATDDRALYLRQRDKAIIPLIRAKRWADLVERLERDSARVAASEFREAWRQGLSEWNESPSIFDPWEKVRLECGASAKRCEALDEATQLLRQRIDDPWVDRWLGDWEVAAELQWNLEPGDLLVRVDWLPPFLTAVAIAPEHIYGNAIRLSDGRIEQEANPWDEEDLSQLLRPLWRKGAPQRLFLALDDALWDFPWPRLKVLDAPIGLSASLAYGPDLTTWVESFRARRVGSTRFVRIVATPTAEHDRRVPVPPQLAETNRSAGMAVADETIDVPFDLLTGNQGIGYEGSHTVNADTLTFHVANDWAHQSDRLWLDGVMPYPSNPYLTGMPLHPDKTPDGWWPLGAMRPGAVSANIAAVQADWTGLPDRRHVARWSRRIGRILIDAGAAAAIAPTYRVDCEPTLRDRAYRGFIGRMLTISESESFAAAAIDASLQTANPADPDQCDVWRDMRLVGYWGMNPVEARRFAENNLIRTQREALASFAESRFEEAADGFSLGLDYLALLDRVENRDRLLKALAASLFQMGKLEGAAEAQSELVALYDEQGDRGRALAEALMQLARLEERLERIGEAESAYAEAQKIYRRLDLLPEEAQALLAMGDLADLQGRREEAVQRYREGIEGLEERQPELRVKLYRAMSRTLYQGLADYPGAIAANLNALRICRALGRTIDQASILSDIGLIHQKRFNFNEAISLQEQAIKLLSEAEPSVESRRGILQSKLYQANSYWLTGRLALAEEMAQQAQAEAKALGEKALEAMALNLSGLTALYRGDFEKALVDLRNNLALSRERGGENSASVAAALNNLGRAYRDMGNYAEARDRFEEALEIDRDDLNTEGLAFVQRHLAHLSLLEGKYEEAEKHLRSAMENAVKTNQQTIMMHVHAHEAWMRWRLGEPNEARNRLEKALALESDSTDLEHTLIAFRMYRLLGKLSQGEERRAALAKAVELVEERWIWEAGAWAFLLRRDRPVDGDFLDSWRGAYDDLVADAIERGDIEEALHWMERYRWLRARIWYARFADWDEEGPGGLEPQLWRQAKRLVQQAEGARLLRGADRYETQLALTERWAEWGRSRGALRQQNPSAAARLGDLSGLANLSGPRLEFWSLPDRTLRFFKTSSDSPSTVHAIPLSRSDLANRKAELIDRMETWAPVETALIALSQPLLERWKPDSDTLSILADEFFAGLPWAAFRLDEKRRLGEAVSLAMPIVRNGADRSKGQTDKPLWIAVAGVGKNRLRSDPVMAYAEIEEIAALHSPVMELNAGELSGWEDLQGPGWDKAGRLHLATHQESEAESARFRLNPTASIRLSDLFGAPLDGLSVALSACRTASSSDWPQISPAEAFAFMGAEEIEATQWRIGDVETALLFKHYYRSRVKGSDGPTALRQAQQKVSAYHPHPSAWAGLVWIGGEYPAPQPQSE